MIVPTFSMAAAVAFASPWWLAGVLLALGPVVLARAARKRGRHVAPVSVVLRCIAVAAAALALARPAAPIGPAARRPWLVLDDVSASTRGQHDAPLDLPDDLRREEYGFAAGVAPAGRKVDAAQTNLAPVLRLAAARAGELSGAIIRTDGQFTDSDWPAAAEALARTGLPVLIVPLAGPPRDAAVTRLTARRRPDGSVALRVHMSANAAGARTLVVWRGRPDTAREDLLRRELKFLPGEPISLSLSDMPAEGAAVRYSACLSPPDRFPENDSAKTVLLPLRRRVAWVGARGGYHLPGPIPGASFAVDRLAPADLPPAQMALADYAAVVVVDAGGKLLSPEQREALGQYVRSGGGLVIVGAGPHGSPEDRNDPLNRVAALMPNPYDRKPLAVTVVLDASGSMGRRALSGPARQMKFDQAVEAVLDLRRHLTPRDALRVIVFSDEPREVYAAAPGEVSFARLGNALRQVTPNGATKVYPAMKLSAGRDAAPPHQGLVLLVSDLQTERFDIPAAAEMFRKHKLRLAIVAISAEEGDAAAPLDLLASRLGAPLEKRDRLTGLAKVFAGFLRGARGSAVRTGRFELNADAPVFGAERLAGRAADAYILCAPREGARVVLRAGGDPVLALRTAGLGRCVSLALPLGGRHNVALREAPELASVLAESVRWTMCPGEDPRFSGRIERTPPRVRITVSARDDAGPMNLLKLAAEVISGGAEHAERVQMHQTAPGRYEARLAAAPGPLTVAVSRAESRTIWRGALGGYPREFAAIGPNWRELRRLAQLTGGVLTDSSSEAVSAARSGAAGRTPLWPWLLAVALAAMLGDWILARGSQVSRGRRD